eukprot:3230566-Prymnesium_polylepis.1
MPSYKAAVMPSYGAAGGSTVGAYYPRLDCGSLCASGASGGRRASLGDVFLDTPMCNGHTTG